MIKKVVCLEKELDGMLDKLKTYSADMIFEQVNMEEQEDRDEELLACYEDSLVKIIVEKYKPLIVEQVNE